MTTEYKIASATPERKAGLFYQHQLLIDSRDVDGRDQCRPSALLGHLQEAATLAAEDGGFGRDRLLKEYNAFWMLARMWYRLDRPLHWGEMLTVRTWHRGGKSASMYRDFDLLVGDEPVGEAVSMWVLADLESRKLLRLGEIPALEGTDGGGLCKSMTLARLRLPREMELTERRRMRYSDTDVNGHVNNTRYADFACDALNMERLPEDVFVQSMQLGYTAECRPGETLVLLTAGDGEEYFVKGMDDNGKDRFQVRLTFGQARC